jgi:chemotaxis protein CheX
MEALWVNAFVKTTVNVFATMFQTEARPGTPRLKGEPYPVADISGMIGFSGGAQGSVAYSFPRETILKLVGILFGNPPADLNRDVGDAVGEIANIVAGNAKTEIPNVNLSISLPQVVVGSNHTVSVQTSIPVVIVPFTTPHGDFVMELSLRKR